MRWTASVNGIRVDLIRIGVPDAVFADPFHDPPVRAPALGHVPHVVVGRVVDCARAALKGTLLLVVYPGKTFTAFEFPDHVREEVVGLVEVGQLIERGIGGRPTHVVELHDEPGDLHGRSSISG
jgi:hypothetical protein